MRIKDYQEVINELGAQLNEACELLTELEYAANEEQQERIDGLFARIKYFEELDAEMNMLHINADDEAQDWEVFGENKI